MNNDTRYLRLSRMLNPRSIVFVGGSALEPAIEYARQIGYPGDCFVINPRRDQVHGIECLRSAGELKKPADVAFVAVPAGAAVEPPPCGFGNGPWHAILANCLGA